MSPTPPDDGPSDYGPTESLPSRMAGTPAAAHPPFESGNALPAGTALGEFEVLGVAGEGGFSIVYRAWDRSLKRTVAIKEYMPASLALRSGGLQVGVRSERHAEPFYAGLQSFVKEAQMLAQFDHPALVKVFRFWEANGSAYMAMPFYQGKTLREELRLRKTPPDEATILGWIGPVADALAVIHAEHWYHRDIAPDNVLLLAGSNRPLLLDFGAARRVIGDMTQALTVILKPGYAPVEQYAEIPGMKQGPWTDVYALAAVAYYAIMGKVPPPSVGRLVNDSYEPVAKAAAGRYSERLLNAIDLALTVRPAGRTRSIAEFKVQIGLAASVAEAAENRYPSSHPGRDDLSLPPAVTEPDLLLPDGPDLPLSETTDLLLPVELPVPAPAPVPLPMPMPLPLPLAERTAVVPSLFERTRAVPSPRREAVAAPVPAPAPAPAGSSRVWVGAGLAALALAGVGGFFALRAPSPAPVAAAPAPAPAPVLAAPAPAPVAAAEVPRAPSWDAAAEFDRVVAAQTPGWGLEVKVAGERLRIDKDKLVFTLRSLQEGYVYVFNQGADGLLQQLYPNALTPAPRIVKGGSLKLPQGSLEFNVAAPAGTSRLLVMVSRWPRDHKAFAPRVDGGFTSYPTGAEAAVLAAASTDKLPLIAGRPVCPQGGGCGDEFGAATTQFEVVP